MSLRVTLTEAVEGAKVPVQTPSGGVSLTVPPGSNSGDVLKLRGKGVQVKPAAGDLLVKLIVVLPEGVDSELRAFVKKWAGRDYQVRR